MWTFLKDTSERDMVAFNHMHFPEEDKEGDFKMVRINWHPTAPAFTYTRHRDVVEGQPDSRKFSIVSSDWAYFMIGATCSDEGGDAHWDYVVFTRDKGPSKFMRQKVRGLMMDYGVDVASLTKGRTLECWGEDMLGK